MMLDDLIIVYERSGNNPSAGIFLEAKWKRKGGVKIEDNRWST